MHFRIHSNVQGCCCHPRLRSSSPRKAALKVSVVIEPVVSTAVLHTVPMFNYLFRCCT